jgi:hypothetical protein
MDLIMGIDAPIHIEVHGMGFRVWPSSESHKWVKVKVFYSCACKILKKS